MHLTYSDTWKEICINMKIRMILEFLVTLFLIIDLTVIILYFNVYIFSPFIFLLILSMFRFRYVFYSKLDYNDNSHFVVYRENFILFSLYIFKGKNKKYIDDGYYFCKRHENTNATLDYIVSNGNINVILKKNSFKSLHILAFIPVFVKWIFLLINERTINDGGTELLLLTAFSIINLFIVINSMQSKSKIRISVKDCKYLQYSTLVDINSNWLSLNSCYLTCRTPDNNEVKILDSKNYWFLYFVKNRLERVGENVL